MSSNNQKLSTTQRMIQGNLYLLLNSRWLPLLSFTFWKTIKNKGKKWIAHLIYPTELDWFSRRHDYRFHKKYDNQNQMLCFFTFKYISKQFDYNICSTLLLPHTIFYLYISFVSLSIWISIGLFTFLTNFFILRL